MSSAYPPRRRSASNVRRMLIRKRISRALLRHAGVEAFLERLFARGQRIEVTRHVVDAPLRAPLTIAHVTDLHLTRIGPHEERVLAVLDAERPDLIALTGDVATLGGSDPVYREMLGRMHAPRGVWMVLGNWDHWSPPADARSLAKATGVRLLVNEAAELEPGVWIAGFDDAVAGAPDADRALAPVPNGAWVLALFHCPVYLEAIAGRFALGLSGHTHGGQIRIPGLPPLVMPAGCWPYVSGWYERGGSRMYVSRGLASPGIPVRAFCRPEIAMFTLRPAT